MRGYIMKISRIAIALCLAVFIVLMLSASSFAEAQDTGKKITFNFIDVEIPAVIEFISELTGKNFIFDKRIKGNITIIAPTRLTVDESFALFTSVLQLKGYTLVPAGAMTYKIILSSMARQSANTFTEDTVPIDETYITRLLPVKNIKADEAMKMLQPFISRNGHISSFGPGNLLLVADSALNIDKLMSILRNIDKPPTYAEPANINVYFLENADATDLAKVLEGIIKGTRAATRTARQKKDTPTKESLLTDIIVTPDKATNSLIIVASPGGYDTISQVIKKLDRRRRQVFVEAMIVEARIDKLKELGSKWRASVSIDETPVTIGGFGTLDTAAMQNILAGLTGFSMGGLGNFLDIPITTINSDGTFGSSSMTVPGFAALFDLSEFNDAINILSTPQILTSNNQEAEIIVGENVPFISKSQRDLASTSAVLSSIERQDVGITLRITPQITEGDYVKLDLYQEISSVKEDSENITISVGPTTTKRATKTSVVVRDGQTVVISGLMQEIEENSVAKTPILGDIPIIGWLFKHKTITKKKTNLLIFITPHIVKDSAQMAAITNKKYLDFASRESHYIE
ncbi:MAG TPA: hypothetical protein ENH31_08410, partial [Nitrospirae bacterium]|nr:hypothetical protein [Nitrospirota bacterium]